MARVRGLRQDSEISASLHNRVLEDAIAGYPTLAERNADFFAPITNLWVPAAAEDPPTLGENVSIEGADRFFGAWAGDTFKHWRRVAETESGVIQVVVADTTVREQLTGDATATFQVWLVDADATLADHSQSGRGIQPRRLDGRVLVDYRFVEYDPRPLAQRTTPLTPEARANVDFLARAGTIVWNPSDTSIVKLVSTTVYATPEVEGDERFQIELFNFRGAKPLKDIGICVITETSLPLLRAEDVTIQTRRAANPLDPAGPPLTDINQVSAIVPISLSEAATVDTPFNYETFDGTATSAGGDYTAIPSTRGVIRAGQTTPETPVQVTVPRQPLEATEQFGLRLSPIAGTNPTAIFVKPISNITIAGAALKPTLYAPVEIVGPGNGGAYLTSIPIKIICSPVPTAASGPIVVAWNTDDTLGRSHPLLYATSGYHYVTNSGTLTFNIGEAEKTIAVSTNWDWLYHQAPDPVRHAYEREPLVELVVNLRITSGDGLLQNQLGGTGIMRTGVQLSAVRRGGPEDPALATFTAADFTTPEPPGVMARQVIRIPVELATSPPAGITASVEWHIETGGARGTAVDGTDFSGIRTATGARTIRWTSTGNRTQHMEIAILRNTARTGDRHFHIGFTNPVNCTAGVDAIRVTIEDRETPRQTGEYQVSGQDIRIVEPASGTERIEFPITISRLPTGAGETVYVDYAPSQGTGPGGAIAGTHYQRVSKRRAEWISTSDRTQFYPFTIIGGNNITAPVTFRVFIGDEADGVSSGMKQPTDLTVERTSGYRITITPRDAEDVPTPELPTASAPSITVDEDAGQAVITATLSSTPSEETSMDYATADDTAIAGEDYTAATGTLTWPAGQREATLNIPILINDQVTRNTRFQINWSAGVNCTPPDRATTVTIRNIDAAPVAPEPEQPPDVNIGNSSVQVPTTGTRLGYLTISTSRSLTEAITGTASSRTDGTATAGTHYRALTVVPWTIAPGAPTTRIPVTVLASVLTADVYVDVDIQITSGNATVDDGRGRLTLTSNQVPITLSVADVTLTSRGGLANVVVSRTGDTTNSLTFTVQTLNATARSGIHYTAIPARRVTIPAGQTSTTIQIQTAVARSRTPSQTFLVRVSNPSEGTIADRDGTVTLPAFNPPVVTVPFITLVGGSVQEPATGGQATVPFVIRASKVWTAEIRGSYRTSDITATAGSDYTRTLGTWRIPVGQRTTTIRIPVLADTTAEGNETFRFTITLDSGNARFAGGAATLFAVGTIRNRDTTTVALSVQDATANRTDRGADFPFVNVQVTSPAAPTGDVTFRASTYSTGSAITTAQNAYSGDYQAIDNQTYVLRAGTTSVNIPINWSHHYVAQPRETFGVRIHTPGSGVSITRSQAIVTLSALPADTPWADPGVILRFFPEDQDDKTQMSIRPYLGLQEGIVPATRTRVRIRATVLITDSGGGTIFSRNWNVNVTYGGEQTDDNLYTNAPRVPTITRTIPSGSQNRYRGVVDLPTHQRIMDEMTNLGLGRIYVSAQIDNGEVFEIDLRPT